MNRSAPIPPDRGHSPLAPTLLTPTLLTLASLALLNGAALAQTAAPDLSLSAYRSMAAALDRAVSDRPASSAASLSDLDRATAAYATLKPGISSPMLVSGLDRALQSSRAALSRAPADLEAQVEQARSLMRKALYDQSLGGQRSGQPSAASTRDQATLLATEFGLENAVRASFLTAMSSRDTGAAARLLRRAAAQKIQASLSGATVPQNSAQRTASYLALARATGWFTVAQDAPDTGGLKLPLFTQALSDLTGDNAAALASSLTDLRRGATDFVAASEKAVRTGSALPPTSQPPAAVPPAQLPTTPTRTPATQTPDTRTPATQTPDTQTPATTPAPAPSAADRQKAGLNATYAALARAQAAAGHASLQEARTELDRASQALPSSGLDSTAGYDTLSSDLAALATRSGLRAGDVQAVMAELSNLESRANARPTSTLDTTSAGVSRLGTPIWPLLFLIVGLLSLYPLYLLNLAFGGRNNYWRAIAASLGLLFLPLLLEGLGGTFAYLGDLTGLGVLRALGNLSLYQGAWGLPVWLLLAAGAVALSSYGFRGLCQQFGLLGGSGGSANPTRTDVPQPALDWDEEL